MTILSKKRHEELLKWKDRCADALRRAKALEAELQELKLLVGYEGLEIFDKPEIPAKPAERMLRRRK